MSFILYLIGLKKSSSDFNDFMSKDILSFMGSQGGNLRVTLWGRVFKGHPLEKN